MENDDKNVSAFWAPPEDYEALRMPKTIRPISSTVTSESNNSTASSLRPEAAEWYPPTYSKVNTDTRKSNKKCGGIAQQRLNKFKLKHQNDYDHENLCLLISNLVLDPGKFDEFEDMFNDVLTKYTESDPLIPSMASFIFETALVEHSFRYNGARICLIFIRLFPSFKNLLINIAKKYLENPVQPGLALFLGELFSQIDCCIEIGEHLIFALNKLIDNMDDESIKAVCQTLKLCGWSLEAQDPTSITFIISRIKEIKNKFPTNIQNLIKMVCSLKDTNWGRSTLEITNSDQNGDWPQEPEIENPTLYGPDGMELTLEEQEFLAKNCKDFDEYDSDTDVVYDTDPRINEEIKAAFEEFVKLNEA